MAKLQGVTDLLRELVAIPSVNPNGHPGTDRTGEEAMAHYIRDFLKGIGAQVEVTEVVPGRPNVVGAFPAAVTRRPASPHSAAALRAMTAEERAEREEESHGTPRVVFAPHTDTVSVAGMTIKPFDPVIKGGKLYGRGSSDTKGPLAASLWALHEWAKSPARRTSTVTWVFAGLMGEEAGNEGAIHLAGQRGFSADLVIALEPTKLKVVHAHKGALWLDVVATGKSCHASTPERGRNAIYTMRRVLEVLEKKAVPMIGKRKHPTLGHSSLSVGTIRGGSKVNIVPDLCAIECDLRLVPGLEPEAAQKLLAQLLKRTIGDDVKVSLQRHAPPLDTKKSLPWVKALAKVGRGFDVAPWFCDAAIFARRGIPAVAFGPGSIAQAHTEDEFISIADLEQGARTFGRFLQMTPSTRKAS